MVDRLGCGTYEAYFNERRGEKHTCRIRNITSLTWNRKLNDTSDATVAFSLNGWEAECCNCVSTVNPWEHELSIYRDGAEVWCGPVVNATVDLDSMTATYEARDLSAWFDHRWVELYGQEDQEFDETPVTEVYDWLIGHAYYKDPWNMQWALGSMNLPITRTYTAASFPDRWGGNFPTIGNELRDLSKYGIDFTLIRRIMLGGDLDQSVTPVGMFLDSHWESLPKIIIAGGGMATEVGMAGGNGGFSGWDDDQIWIERPYDAFRAKYGLLQSFFTAPEADDEDTTKLPNAVTQQAYGLRELKKQPFVYIKGGSLSAEAPVTFDQLVPGNVFHVGLTQTCRTVQADYRLYEVDVQLQGKTEQVSLQLTPLGADALRT